MIPETKQNRHPIQLMVCESSHLRQEMGKQIACKNRIQKAAVMGWGALYSPE
jgi:hypothetical protein